VEIQPLWRDFQGAVDRVGNLLLVFHSVPSSAISTALRAGQVVNGRQRRLQFSPPAPKPAILYKHTVNETQLFQAALGLLPPWLVDHCRFTVESGRLDIYLDFPRGSAFPCPVCGAANCKAYDTDTLTWRHLNFFQHQTYLHARTPRVQCSLCGVHRVAVPWARPDSGFTLLFDAFVLQLVKAMPVLAAARLVGEHDTLVWRIVNHYVDSARSQADHSSVTQLGIDETAARRGQDYVSLFVDLQEHKVLFVTPGNNAATVSAFAQDLQAHQGDPQAITEVSIDMSAAFINGVGKHLPNASLTFDKFHAVSLVNEAVDDVRRLERKLHPELSGTRYLWLKNPDNLTANQEQQLQTFDLTCCHLKTARAYQIRLVFQDLYKQPPEEAELYLKRWYFWATHSRIQPIIDVARTIRRHQAGILRWFTSRINNGILEGINSLVQAAKARGYRSTRNFASIIYLIAGKLDLSCQPT
jgi:transposase